MTLTNGVGPFGPRRAGWSAPPLPDSTIVYVEPHPRRVHAVVDGEVVLDTERVLLVHRSGSALAYAFRQEDVAPTGLPSRPEPEAPGYVQVPWDAVDTWFEEGRRLVHYPPNPYHRVDCRPTRRQLQVVVAGEVLVDTDDTIILFETALDPVLYVDPAQVRTDLLRRSQTWSWCNYKGDATWWSAHVGDTVVDDVAWSYEDPLPESTPIRGFLSFDGSRDGVDVEAELPSPD